MQLALRAAGVGAGDLVLIPDATFWATFEAVVNCGARVVTVDVDLSDLQMDFELFAKAVDEYQPKAAILVHLYGWGSARLADFRALCRDRELPLIEDAAQAFGCKLDGKPIFEGAELATISFYPATVLGSCGDAGAVLARDADTAATIRQLGNHGRTSHYGHGLIGWNSRLGGYDAAYLNLSLDYIDRRLDDRRRLAKRYHEARDGHIEMVGPPNGYEGNGYLNVCLPSIDDRERIAGHLKERGIGTGQVYPGAMSKQPGAGEHLHARVGGEKADELCRRVLNLPLFAYMSDDEQDEVVNAVIEAI